MLGNALSFISPGGDLYPHQNQSSCKAYLHLIGLVDHDSEGYRGLAWLISWEDILDCWEMALASDFIYK